MANGEAPRRRSLSVRLRLLLPIVVTIAGMLTLGGLQVQQAMQTDADAARAKTLADLANTTAKLLHVGQDEVAATLDSHEANGKPFAHDFAHQIATTDKFIKQFKSQTSKIRKQVPSLNAVMVTANGALGQVHDARKFMKPFAKDKSVSVEDPDTTSGFELYRSISNKILDVADALHTHITDHDLARQARAEAALAGAKLAAGNERVLVHNLLAVSEKDLDHDGKNDPIPASQTTSLARYQGIEEQRLGEFYRAASPRAKGLYYTKVYGPAVDRADHIIDNLLQQRPPGASAKKWDEAQGRRIEELHEVESQLAEDLGDSAQALREESRTSALITGGSAVGVAVITFVAALLLALRISKRLRVLRRDALSAAEDTLPTAVATMTEARSEKQVSDAVGAAEHLAMTSRPGPNDEVAAVSQAFNVVHSQALRLAADQAMLRLDVAAMMIALARRGQSLVQRQLHMLDEFTEATRDPVGLERMRSLNHMASRMRRNEENLLLLAGGDPGRRHISAITVASAVVEASAEIEDSSRITVEDAADTPIVAGAVGDVVHLLAELLENAAQFSAPTTHVRVATRRTVHEVVISINDEGIGLPEEQVAEINERLREPSGLTSSLAGTMGLLVVARLAERHGIEVQLHSTAGKGTLAVVRVPESLIAGQDGPRTGTGAGPSPAGLIDLVGQTLPSAGLKALSDRPSAIPVTGTGEETSITDSSGVIVPRPRTPGAATRDPRPVPATPDPTAAPTQTGWFMPATGSGDFPALPPGSLSWQAGTGDMAYDQARQAIAAASEPPAPEATTEEGALPKRRPGARLLPGSVETPANASPLRGGSGDEGIDPDEIRSRLAGFAGGIAAASDTSSTMDIRRATDKS